MKTIFTFFLAIITIASFASSNDSTTYSVVKYSQGTFITANDTIGLLIVEQGVGISRGDALIAIMQTENGVKLAMGTSDENNVIKGISISADANIIFINASTIVIARKSFVSHGEADAALISVEEYYLAGDRLTYHKP